MQDYSHIQKPDLGYRYEFSTDELERMDECLEGHGFAIIKDALPEEIVERLKQAVYDGTDPEGTLAEGQSRTRHAWVESGAGAWSLMDYEPFMDLHRHLIGRGAVALRGAVVNLALSPRRALARSLLLASGYLLADSDRPA